MKLIKIGVAIYVTLFALTAQAEVKKFLTLEDAVVVQARKWQETGVAKPILSDDGRIMYPFGQYMPKLVCTLLRACDIQLEPGELVKGKPVAGDTARFMLSKQMSGSGDKETTHIIVKPTETDIKTNLNIYTDRRVYQVLLISSKNEEDYLNAIGFYYPENVAEEWDESARASLRVQSDNAKTAAAQMPAACVSAMDFDYSIEGNSSFRPLRVYNSCGKVYIHMPEGVTVSTAPILIGLGPDGNAEHLNWRAKLPTVYEVDKLFDKAIMVLGSDDDEQKIIITWNKNTKKKPWFTFGKAEANR